METGPLVSVCIPLFNSAAFIADCLCSVVNQSYKNIEIIIVDNGSTDDSINISKSFRNQNIKIHFEVTKGAARARNRALNIAKGKYIQFLDADDLLSPDKIENQVTALETHPEKLAVCSTIHFFDNEDCSNFKPSPYEEQFLYNTNDPVEFVINLWGGNDFKASMVQPNAWLTPMDIILKSGFWNESLTLDDDGEFFARVLLHSSGVIKTEGLNYYRKHKITSVNLSAQKNKIALTSAFHSILLKRDSLFRQNVSEKANKAIYKQLKELSTQCYLYHPKLYAEIRKELVNFNDYDFVPVFGSEAIEFISKYIGWKTAKRGQRIYHRFKKMVNFYKQ